MSLYILNPSIQPLGQFDVLDTDMSSITGGEIAVLDRALRANSSTEKAASDVQDGYVADLVDSGDSTQYRVVARLADGYSDSFLDATKGNTKVEPRRAFYLIDDGSANYGTLFGGLVGTPLGLGASGSQLGPHTASASGKVTLWDKPGLYAVSAGSTAADLNPLAGNLNDTPLPGDILYREHDTGKLTVNSITGDKIGAFVELRNSGSLVTTPSRLVGATEVLDRIVFQFFGATHNA